MVDKYFFWEAGVPPIGWKEVKAKEEHDEAKYFASIDPHYGELSSRVYKKCLERTRSSRFVMFRNLVGDRLRIQQYQGREYPRD